MRPSVFFTLVFALLAFVAAPEASARNGLLLGAADCAQHAGSSCTYVRTLTNGRQCWRSTCQGANGTYDGQSCGDVSNGTTTVCDNALADCLKICAARDMSPDGSFIPSGARNSVPGRVNKLRNNSLQEEGDFSGLAPRSLR